MTTRMILYNFIPGFSARFLEAVKEPLKIEHAEIIDGEKVQVPAGFTYRLYDANALHYGDYQVDWNRLRPLDEEIVWRMAPWESMVLRVLDKLGKIGMRLRWAQLLDRRCLRNRGLLDSIESYDLRKSIYLKHLRFWNHVISEKDINLFISTNIPHVGADYVIYGLCTLRKIPFLTFESIRTIGRVRALRDLEDTTLDVRERFMALQTRYGATPLGCSLTEGSERFWQTYTSVLKDPVPWYMTTPGFGFNHHMFGGLRMVTRQIRGIKSLLKGTMSPWGELARLVTEYRFARRTKLLRRYYDSIAEEPRFDEKYVYVPLHYQPEISTAPLAGSYVDQKNIVDMLAAVIPDDVKVWVKEHPAQTCNGRSRLFYDDLSRMSKVRLIESRTSTFRLIDSAIAVATCTGTVGWEALMRGKPVLVFGEVCYNAAPGAFRIKTVEDCERAVQNLVKTNGAGPSPGEMRIFLRALEECSKPGEAGRFGASLVEGVDFSHEESLNSICELAVEALASMRISTAPSRKFEERSTKTK